jgi:hypothetical protein
MKLQFPCRTACADGLFVSGWAALVFLGQALIPIEVPVLEWLSIGWLLAGLIMVRIGTGLPLLLLTCSTFLCEPHRAWAWAQPLAALALLARLLFEGRFSRRDALLTLLAGVIVAWASWPADAGALLQKLSAFPKRELVTQWFRPEASWAIYPFRATADRALIAMLATALIVKPLYVFTHRIWKALFGAGLLAITVSLSSAIIPWHEPHRFLGTTNFTSCGDFLFSGAGYNPCYIPILLAAALPWLFTPLDHRHRWIHVGLVALLPPLWFLVERSLRLLVIVFAVSWLFSLIHVLFSCSRRRRFVAHVRQLAGASKKILTVFLVSALLSVTWFVKMGIRDATSPLRIKMRTLLHQQDSTWSRPIPYGNFGAPSQPSEVQTMAGPVASPTPTPATLVRPHLPWEGRLEKFLAQFDPARASMWMLGLRHASRSGFWHGEGAGTWARFHRNQPRPASAYFAHMHNTYLDLIFEYGLVPMLVVYGLCVVAFFRIAFGLACVSRIWLFYLVFIAVVALGQHLFFTFTHLCLLLPAFILIPRALLSMVRRRPATVSL